MKKVYLFFAFIPFISFSQTGPAGIGDSSNNEIWLVVEDNCYTDTGSSVAGNNDNVQQWNDVSGNSNHALQSTSSYRPVFKSNQANGFPTLEFDGSADRILCSGVGTSHEVTLFVVVKFNALSNNNDGIIQATPSGRAFTTNVNDKSIGMWVKTNNGNLWGRGVEADVNRRNIPQTTSLTTGRFYVLTQQFDGSNITQYVNGATAGSVSYDGTLQSWTDFGIGRQANESLDGEIAEVVVFTSSLNSVQRVLVQNYLASKYCVALTSNDLYDEDDVANGNFDFEVAAIGRMNATNFHNDAQGTSLVRILNPDDLDDNEYLFWGHDNGLLSADETIDVPSDVEARFERLWRVSEVNSSSVAVDVGAIDVRFDLNDFAAVNASDLRLLVDTNNNGLFNDETAISGATSLGGNIYQFAGVTAISNNVRFTLGTSDAIQSPLPIELVYFKAEPVNKQKVALSWQTEFEQDNNYFTIERSKNGESWEVLKRIQSEGNSTSLRSYSWKDDYPYDGTSYYRLKQTDFDGQFTYSKVEEVNLNILNGSKVLIYPNPTNNAITLKGKGTELEEISIYNMLGQKMSYLTNQFSGNETTIMIDLSDLVDGTYFIKTKSTTTKITKQ